MDHKHGVICRDFPTHTCMSLIWTIQYQNKYFVRNFLFVKTPVTVFTSLGAESGHCTIFCSHYWYVECCITVIFDCKLFTGSLETNWRVWCLQTQECRPVERTGTVKYFLNIGDGAEQSWHMIQYTLDTYDQCHNVALFTLSDTNKHNFVRRLEFWNVLCTVPD